MRIILSPIAGNKTTTVSISGLIFTIDGSHYDISDIPKGGQAEATENSPFIGIVTHEQVTIQYEYDSQLAVPDQSTDWADYTYDMTDGEVPCPIEWKQGSTK